MVSGQLLSLSWELSFETPKVSCQKKRANGINSGRSLLPFNTASLASHLIGVTGTCPGGPGIPRVAWSAQMAPKPINTNGKTSRKPKGKPVSMSCHLGVVCIKHGAQDPRFMLLSLFLRGCRAVSGTTVRAPA